MSSLPSSFGQWLKELRIQADLSQQDLADLVPCSVVTIRKIESGERRPSKQIGERLAEVLAVSSSEHLRFMKLARPVTKKLPTIARSSTRLPAETTSFVGRTKEVTQIVKRLSEDNCRFVTLLGSGGVGKTRLALKVMQQVEHNYRDGVHFIAAGGIAIPLGLIAGIATAVNFAEFDTSSPKYSLYSYLEDKEVLLVIDNFEHLLKGASFLTEMLEYAKHVKLLLTSRERVNSREEWVIEIDGLAFPDMPREASAYVEASATTKTEEVAKSNLKDYEAVQLFTERALQVQLNFHLDHELDDVIRLCQLVNGSPLALELAATWLRLLSCADIVRAIENNLDFLSVESPTIPEKHRSIRAVFEETWHRLSSEEQRILPRLTVFWGEFTVDAAIYVTECTDKVLISLRDKSLINRTQQGHFALHNLLSQYTEAKLDLVPAEKHAVEARHCDYYAQYLTRYLDDFATGSLFAKAEILREFENIRQAWQWTTQANLSHPMVGLWRQLSVILNDPSVNK